MPRRGWAWRACDTGGDQHWKKVRSPLGERKALIWTQVAVSEHKAQGEEEEDSEAEPEGEGYPEQEESEAEEEH